MGERFDMSRPIYAQIVERLKAKILAGVLPARRTSGLGARHGRSGRRQPQHHAAGTGPAGSGRARLHRADHGPLRHRRYSLLEQLRDETARAMTAEYLEKMRGIGYGPAEAAKLMTGWETKESD